MEKNKKDLEIHEDKYRKCSLCDTAYMNMIRISLKQDGYILLCKKCFMELKESLNEW